MQETFGADLPVYTFQNICAEKSGLALNDGAKKFFFNAASAENEKDLAIKAFLNYINNKDYDCALSAIEMANVMEQI